LSSEAEAPGGVEAAPVDQPSQALVDRLRGALGDGMLAHEVTGGDVWVRVAPERWYDAVGTAKAQLGLTYFCFLSAIDWMQVDLTATKLWDPDAEPSEPPGDGPGHWRTGIAGGDTRFQVMCRLYDVEGHLGLTLKADCGDENPRLASVVGLFRGADWHEREAWEMYGIEFEGHPGLRHLYLPTEFEGHPLRKDFPLLAREVKPWPGLVNVEGLPGEPDAGAEDGAVSEDADA